MCYYTAKHLAEDVNVTFVLCGFYVTFKRHHFLLCMKISHEAVKALTEKRKNTTTDFLFICLTRLLFILCVTRRILTVFSIYIYIKVEK